MAKSRFWVEIVCTDCAKTHAGSGQFVHGGAIPVREMNRAAVADGWMILNNGEHRCKSCVDAVLKSVGVRHGE